MDDGQRREEMDRSMITTEPLITVCAWCFPNDRRPNVTHGICERHRHEQLEELDRREALRRAVEQERGVTTNGNFERD